MAFWNRKKKEERSIEYVQCTSQALPFTSILGRNSAMALSAVYRATEIISDAIAVLPLDIKKKGKVVKNHPITFALSNMLLTRYEFMKLLVQSVLLKGNGFALIQRAMDGTVTGLQYLESGDVVIHYNKLNGELYYTVTGVRGKIEPVNMIHFVKNSYDGVQGISVISYASRTINIAQSTENSALNFFEKGMNLSGVLNVNTANLSEEQRKQIFASWNSAYTNGGNGLVVLKGDWKYTPIQLNAEDAQLLQSREYNIEDIARFFGISPILLGDLNHSSYNSIEASQQEFLLHTLLPYISMIEEEFNRKLLLPSEKESTIIDIDENAMLKVDKTAEAGYYTSLLQNGVMSINEVRSKLGMLPIEDGDKHIIPFTDVQQNTINNNTTENTVEDNAKDK